MQSTAEFTIHPHTGKKIYSETAGIEFPPVYRIVQTITPEILKELGGTPGQVSSEPYTYYTLNPDHGQYPGATEATPVATLDADETFTLVVRHHKDGDTASAYLSAFWDLGIHQDSTSIHENEHGAFTLIKRPTHAEWPSPLIVYTVDFTNPKAQNVLEEFATWQLAVASDGSEADVILYSEED